MLNTNELDQRARDIISHNDMGGYTVPTHGLYPYQWNWDSAFAAWGMSSYDMNAAWTEVETLMNSQWDTGMVPHIIFHKSDPGYFPGPDVWATGQSPATSGITQPPVAASMVYRLMLSDPDNGKQKAQALFAKLKAWHGWFLRERCESGAVAIMHPWESGRDNAHDWDGAMPKIDISHVGEYVRRDTSHVDSAMRPTKQDYDRFMSLVYQGRDCNWCQATIREEGDFRVADPGMTFILLRANNDLIAMAKLLDEPTEELESWTATLKNGAATLWNPEREHYDSRDLHSGELANSLSNASFLCWYAGLGNDKMLEHYERVTGGLSYPVPSLDPSDAHFDALRYWRGPTWGIVNTLIGLGLQSSGLQTHAQALREATAELIQKHGFAEYFDPITGQPAGGKDFTWTAAIWLAWASPSATIPTGSE